MGEACEGVTFRTNLTKNQLEERMYEALARIRFTIPILACKMVGDPDTYTRSWVHTASSAQDARTWASESLTVRHGPFDTEAFIAEMNARRLPYTHSTGHEQQVHFYLLIGDDAHHALFMHGTHALMDARPTLRGMDVILQMIANPPTDRVEELPWGTEWRALPPGPINAAGGLREDWKTGGMELVREIWAKITNPMPSHSLHPARDTTQVPGKMVRVHEVIDAETSRRLVGAVKANGFTFSHLADAAVILSVFEGNPPSADCPADTHYTLNPSIISQDKYLLPEHRTPSHFVTGLILVPIDVLHSQIPWTASRKARLLATMQLVKAQYEHYLANPHLPYFLSIVLAVAPMQSPPKLPDKRTSVITNVGVVEGFMQMRHDGEGEGGEQAVVEVEDLAMGQRLTWENQMIHVWTLKKAIHLQTQACDAWDEESLQEQLRCFKMQLLSILDD